MRCAKRMRASSSNTSRSKSGWRVLSNYRIRWLVASERDLRRVRDFLAEVNPRSATKRVRAIAALVRKLPEHTRIGHRLEAYMPREVRALFVDDCEVRYEIGRDVIIILRIWHTREDR